MLGKGQFDATGDTPPFIGKAYETAASTLVESILGEVEYGQRGYDTRPVAAWKNPLAFLTVMISPAIAAGFFGAHAYITKKATYTMAPAGGVPRAVEVEVCVSLVDQFPSEVIQGAPSFDSRYPIGTAPPGLPMTLHMNNVRKVRISVPPFCVEAARHTLTDLLEALTQLTGGSGSRELRIMMVSAEATGPTGSRGVSGVRIRFWLVDMSLPEAVRGSAERYAGVLLPIAAVWPEVVEKVAGEGGRATAVAKLAADKASDRMPIRILTSMPSSVKLATLALASDMEAAEATKAYDDMTSYDTP